LVRKPEGKRPLKRSRCRRENNIKTDLQEVGCEGIDWVDLAQNTERWRAVVNAIMNLPDPQMREISWLAEKQLASQEGIYSMELVSY
jgi:hypothetical protein